MQCRVGCVGKISSGIAEGFSEIEMGQEKGRGWGVYTCIWKVGSEKKKETRKQGEKSDYEIRTEVERGTLG